MRYAKCYWIYYKIIRNLAANNKQNKQQQQQQSPRVFKNNIRIAPYRIKCEYQFPHYTHCVCNVKNVVTVLRLYHTLHTTMSYISVYTVSYHCMDLFERISKNALYIKYIRIFHLMINMGKLSLCQVHAQWNGSQKWKYQIYCPN